MLIGREMCRVDEKWGLRIPVLWQDDFNGMVYLEEVPGGLLRIYPQPPQISVERIPFISRQELREHGVNPILRIPPVLRDSVSFYFGRDVQLVGMISYLEIWPWK